MDAIRALLQDDSIHSVCESAKCPNIGECFQNKTLTFMILGNQCTRNCSFCNITSATPSPVDDQEPNKIAEAVKKLGLNYVVITSVTRDDLSDGGANHFCRVIEALNDKVVEVLIPDLQGNWNALQKIIDAKPAVINHNIETIARLYKAVRPQANFIRSLELIRRVKEQNQQICTKSGFMVGLGEVDEEVFDLLSRLKEYQADIVTIGQYLPPSKNHPKVERFVDPATFRKFKEFGERIGISHVEAGPFVRSSYKAEEIWKKLNAC